MGHHLIKNNVFKSDKYDWCPEGFFALKLTDPIAQQAIIYYAGITGDTELGEDLRIAIKKIREGNDDINLWVW